MVRLGQSEDRARRIVALGIVLRRGWVTLEEIRERHDLCAHEQKLRRWASASAR